MSREVRRGRTTSGQVRVSIINPESKASYVMCIEGCKALGN